MEWITHGERSLYDSHWVNLCLVDVEQPDGRRWEHHVIRMRHLAVVAVVNEAHEVLLVWRHRFVTNTWAWELPMGLIEDDETQEEAAAREVEEETGGRPGTLQNIAYPHPANATTHSEHPVFPLADARTRPPT